MTQHAVFPQIQSIDKIIAVPVVIQRQVPQIQMVSKTEGPEPVLPFQEEIEETIKFFPVERISERNGDHIVDVPADDEGRK